MRRGSADHQIKVGSTTRQLKLMREQLERGGRGRTLYNIEVLAPDKDSAIVYPQVDWIGGHGQHTFLENDKYFEGQSIDTTQPGRVFLGPFIFTVQEDDDSDLDGAPVVFKYFPATSELLMATSGFVYRYIKDDTGINTNEAVDVSETAIDVTPDGSSAIPVNSVIHIDSEEMFVSATGTTLTVVRGFRGTDKATHTTATDIYISKWKKATTTVAGVANERGLEVFGATVFAALGSGTDYKYSTDGITWTTSTLSDTNSVGFLSAPNAAGTADILWKYVTPNTAKNNTSGLNGGAQWSSDITIGESSTNITNVFLENDRLLFGREDGLYHYDSDGGLHQLRPDLKNNRSTDNFKYVAEWQTAIYHSEINGMGEIYASKTYEPMGPLWRVGDIGKRGDIKGIASDKDWLYVAIDEGTNTIIYKGRELRKNGILKWEWCPWIFCGTNAVGTLRVVQHSATDRRLWFGYADQTAYVILSDNPTADSTARFAASGFLRMSYTYGSDPNFDKMWQSAVLQVEGGASGETVQVKYRKDAETSATECIAAATTNGVYESNFSSALTSKRIQFELHLASDTNTATPEVSFFEGKGIEKPTTVRIHDCVYSISQSPRVSVETLRSFMRTARTSTTLIKFADLRYGDSTGDTSYVWVVAEPGYPKEEEIFHAKTSKPELGIRCRFREVSFTVS